MFIIGVNAQTVGEQFVDSVDIYKIVSFGGQSIDTVAYLHQASWTRYEFINDSTIIPISFVERRHIDYYCLREVYKVLLLGKVIYNNKTYTVDWSNITSSIFETSKTYSICLPDTVWLPSGLLDGVKCIHAFIYNTTNLEFNSSLDTTSQIVGITGPGQFVIDNVRPCLYRNDTVTNIGVFQNTYSLSVWKMSTPAYISEEKMNIFVNSESYSPVNIFRILNDSIPDSLFYNNPNLFFYSMYIPRTIKYIGRNLTNGGSNVFLIITDDEGMSSQLKSEDILYIHESSVPNLKNESSYDKEIIIITEKEGEIPTILKSSEMFSSETVQQIITDASISTVNVKTGWVIKDRNNIIPINENDQKIIVYNINGQIVSNYNLKPGVYIIVEGNQTTKIQIK